MENLTSLAEFGKKSSKKTFSWLKAYSNFKKIESAFNQTFANKDEMRNKLRTKGLLEDKIKGIVSTNNKKLIPACKELVQCFVSINEIDELKKIVLPDTINSLKKFISSETK